MLISASNHAGLYWIGAQYKDEQWKWSAGANVDFSKWQEGLPMNGDKLCAAINLPRGGWVRGYCYALLPFFCTVETSSNESCRAATSASVTFSASTMVTATTSTSVTSPTSTAVTSPISTAVTSPTSTAVTSPTSTAVTSPTSTAVTSPTSTAVTSPTSTTVTAPATPRDKYEDCWRTMDLAKLICNICPYHKFCKTGDRSLIPGKVPEVCCNAPYGYQENDPPCNLFFIARLC